VRSRILDVAQGLIEKRGIDAVTLDEIADAADIARRSFYLHFASKNDLLVPVARARTVEINARIDRRVAKFDDPARVMATAMRYTLRLFAADPLCSWFVLHSGLPHQRLHEGVGESAMRDAARGVAAGRFQIENPELVRTLISGAFLAAMSARVEGQIDDGDLDDAVEHILRLLGVSVDEARVLAHEPLPVMRGASATKEFRSGKLASRAERPRR
jgi:AcrR family transcriptional regulator